MVQRIGGARRKTRSQYSKTVREKGKISIRDFLQTFKDGDRVVLNIEPAYQKGVYFRRFHNKMGLVNGKQGKCYKVDIKDQGKPKTVLVHPVHLTKL